jgi:UDP-N-acetyl-D-mannosaminuronate dehydrogenase
MELVELSRRVNDGQVGLAIRTLQRTLGALDGVPVLVLGLTYREGVKELAYSRALSLIERLKAHGAVVWAHDPLLGDAEVAALGAEPYRWGEDSEARAVVTQTADPRWATLDAQRFAALQVLYDGRNSVRGLALPARVVYHGVGGSAANRPAALVPA